MCAGSPTGLLQPLVRLLQHLQPRHVHAGHVRQAQHHHAHGRLGVQPLHHLRFVRECDSVRWGVWEGAGELACGASGATVG